MLKIAVRMGLAAVFGTLLLAGTGCTTSPGYKERLDSSREMRQRLDEESVQLLAEHGGKLAFSEALEVTRARTLALTRQKLEATLAQIDRDSAFAAFLPRIHAAYGETTVYTGGETPLSALGLHLDDTTFSATGISIVQPVFAPAAWMMFIEAKQAKNIGEITLERAGELLDMRVAMLYCQAVVSTRTEAICRSQVASDEALVHRVENLFREGYACEAELARARAKLLASQAHSTQASSDAGVARARLCEMMRLWPLNDFTVDGDSLAAASEWPWRLMDDDGRPCLREAREMEAMPPAELVWQGLLNRKELYAGDQAILLRKQKVVESLAAFLPNLAVGGTWQRLNAGDAVLRLWNPALAGVWSLFNGFQNVNDYRRAREEREAEYLFQEERMLAVVTSVYEAWLNLGVAKQAQRAAVQAASAAQRDCLDAQWRFEDGQETLSTVLDKETARDSAQLVLERTRYAEVLATLALRQALGVGFQK